MNRRAIRQLGRVKTSIAQSQIKENYNTEEV